MNVTKNLAFPKPIHSEDCAASEGTLILNVALALPLQCLFDYLPPKGTPEENLCPGVRVEVPFGRQRKVGWVLAVSRHSLIAPDRLRTAYRLLDAAPLLRDRDLELVNFASRYYHHPIGEVVSASLAPPLRQGKDPESNTEKGLELLASSEITLPIRNAPRQTELVRRLRKEPSRCLSRTEIAKAKLLDAASALVAKGLTAWVKLQPQEDLTRPNENQGPLLTEPQERAVKILSQALERFEVHLLFGVTGSGKTEVYLNIATKIIELGLQILILVPEISLTPQLESRIRQRLSAKIRVLHSGLSDRERLMAWDEFRKGQAGVLLGTRSAVFAPAKNLGLIILDEEHDPSFKQQEGFRFSARDIAVTRARMQDIPVILGSATPSMESYYNAERGRYQRVDLPTRAGEAKPPRFEIVDIRGLWLDEGLSPTLLNRIRETLLKGQQVLLFVNRRGYAPILTCHDCGWLAECENCDTRLVSHRTRPSLRCHHCGYERRLPETCPTCRGKELAWLGLGTERVEVALERLLPKARITRIDRDSIRSKGQLEKRLQEVHKGQIDILIGTQMLAKGHDFPKVNLVGILDVDGGLFSTDFRSGERLAQLVLQVAGRAGRSMGEGQVLLQTRHPDHPLIQELTRGHYEAIARSCLNERSMLALPPFSHQALLRSDALTSETARAFLEELTAFLSQNPLPSVWILGPVEAPLIRKGQRYHWQLLLQSKQREALHAVLRSLTAFIQSRAQRPAVRWSIDVDPIDHY